MNLADGHFLKVGLALQLPAGVDARRRSRRPRTGKRRRSRRRSTRSAARPSTTSDRRTAQAEEHSIGDAVCRKTEGKVLTVYFTDFVMQ